MGFFDLVGDGAKWLNERFNDVEQWVEDVWHGNLGDQAVPAPELVQKVLAGQGAQSWYQGAEQAGKLAGQQDEAGSRVQRLSAGLESAWTGGGADSAQARIKQFSEAATATAQTYTGNGQNLTDLAHGFEVMKKALQPMPDTPPHKNFWDEATWWDTDTEDQINRYNKLAQENLARYQGYAQQAQTSGQGLKGDYGQLTGFDGDISLTPRDSAVSHSSHALSGGINGHSVPRPEVGGSSYVAAPAANSAGVTQGNHYVSPGQDGNGTQAAGYVPPSLSGSRPGALPVSSMPGLSVGTGGGSAWAPESAGGVATGGFGPGGSSGVGQRSGGRGLRGGLNGGAGTGSGAGRGAGAGLGSGAGRGAGSGAGAGGGAGSGAGAEGALRGSAGRGTAGARGASGMGGMGVGGGKGKGEEDAEHQRKYGVEDDSAFSLTDNDGERLLDPRTGLPPTPPTIGG
ncbi:hypothetical protein ATK36_2754 [Amycolatopsis sulphurea]|uniref:PPE family protein n=1 Tax=Amycolatopsis sulphurea TaxID=76022 RepID=A0A2A9FAX6_9PSEU|nr:hypothetical protein [Amycolatopsis sulphurea]PFG47702.1 hypothetical protein ATK36_2754 [Amycolatopsis sulphurea]